jgi:hypothetical protein
MKDFWLSCGHHLLDIGEGGGLVVTDEFLKVYLARPELTPPPEACIVEKTLHAALMSDPKRPVNAEEIAAIADADARENWTMMIAFRDHLLRHPTIEAAYLALIREGPGTTPPLFINQLVHVILRNILDECDDPWILRAAEMFFRPQRLTVHEGSLLAADDETIAGNNPGQVSPLVGMLGLETSTEIDVLGDDNIDSYFERSDRHDMALDLTAGRRGHKRWLASSSTGCGISSISKWMWRRSPKCRTPISPGMSVSTRREPVSATFYGTGNRLTKPRRPASPQSTG